MIFILAKSDNTYYLNGILNYVVPHKVITKVFNTFSKS